MKKLFTLFSMVTIGLLSYGQIVITEISYNGPESGSDSTEFIELYNTTSSSINMMGYTFSSGVVYTFPNVSIAANGYLVVAVDSVAIMNVFGASAYQWTTGGLSNGGEPIALRDSSGVLIDSLRYDDISPWPSAADGGGATLVFCDTSKDSKLGSNWSASTHTVVGTIVNGQQVYGSPGMADSVCSATPPPPVVLTHRTIGSITSEDTNGVADSLNVACFISGVVHGIDMSGLSSSSNTFYVMDATGGIAIYKGGGFTPSYTVNESDSISMYGKVTQFNGLTQFTADSMKVHSTGAATSTITTVSTFDETTEAKYIRIDSVKLVDPSQWKSSGNQGNVDIETLAGDTLVMFIDRDGEIDDSVTAPVGLFDVMGYGSQFDGSNPYTSGYSIVPQLKGHIIKHNSTPPPPPAALPHYGLGVVTTEDASGVADSLNVSCSVSGVVHGIDMSGLTSSSNTFTLMDATGTIAVYKSRGFTPAYTVNESDSISMYGKITQYNGLTQFTADSMKVHSTGAMTSMWTKVSALDESTESQYIRIDSVTLVDASQWPAAGGQTNVQIETQNGDTLVIFIDRDSHVSDSTTAPAGMFDVLGYGGQFDNSSPYTSGYSIIPQLTSHVLPYAAAACNAPTMLDAKSVTDISADLEWMTGGSTTWNVEYGMTGFTQGTGTMMTVTSNPYMLTGLTANTSYEFYVQDSCVGLGTSAWAGPDTFMTAAGPIAIPTYNISDLRTVDANGEIDSVGVNCAIEGIVVTNNFSEAGASGPDVSFVIVDEMNMSGFTAISFDDTATINYAPHIGDSIKVYGTVGQFNGLGQFEIDSVVMYKSMVMVPMPYMTDTLSEMTESRFIELRQVELADTSQWPAVGSDANVDVINQNGDTITMRIDRHTNVASMWPVAPLGKFTLRGVGGQYDGSSPYTSGYQVFPRIYMDIDTASVPPCMDPTNVAVADMDVDTAIVSWTSPMGNSWNVKWGTSSTMASDSAMMVTTNPYVLTGLTKATTYYVWVQENCPGGMSSWVGPVDFSTLTSVKSIAGASNSFVAYPNPNGTDKVNFSRAISVTVRNMTGQVVKSAENVSSLDISELVDGMYLLVSNDGEVVRLIVQ